MAENSGIDAYLQIIRDASDGESVRDAIINCMNKINSDVAVEVYTRTIIREFTQNGTFHEQYPAISGKAYKGVNLDITVNVDGGGGGGDDPGEETSYTHVDAEINNDIQNGSYPPDYFGGDVIDNVVVNLDVYKPDDIGDNVEVSLSDFERGGGTFYATWAGYNALKSITLIDAQTGGGGGTIPTPTPMPGGNGWKYWFYTKPADEAKDTDCPSGWSGVYLSGTVPPLPTNYMNKIKVPNGYTMSGWNPPHQAYSKDVKFYPNFIPTVYGGDKIEETWEQIINNGAMNCNLGDWKTLSFHKTLTSADDSRIPSGETYNYSLTTQMILVAKNETGSKSTWISKYIYPDGGHPLIPDYVPDDTFSYLQDPMLFTTHNNSGFTWLNTVFINKLISEVEGGKLLSGIKPCSKAYIEGVGDQETCKINSYELNQHTSRIWIPSVKELAIEADGVYGQPEGAACGKEWHIDLDGVSRSYIKDMGITTIEDRNNLFLYNNNTFPIEDYVILRDCSYNQFNAGSYTDATIRTAGICSRTNTTARGVSGFGNIHPTINHCIFGFCL